jgi:hypothetical protein
MPFKRAFIDHDGEGKTGMVLGSGHNKLRRLIHGIAGPVPIDNHSIESAARHVVNLALNLRWIRLAIADVHMVRLAEPKNHVGVNFGGSARIEQGMNVDLADVSGSAIVIGLGFKAVRSASIVRSLRRESCGRDHVRGTGRTGRTQSGYSHQQQGNSTVSMTHNSSGAE